MHWNISVGFDAVRELEQMLGVEKVQQALHEGIAQLAPATLTHITEQAQAKLHSRRQAYLDALSLTQDGEEWIVALDGKAMWIEDGKPPGSMVEDLLGDKAKTAKDGSRYRVIPFAHGPGKGPGHQGPSAAELTQSLKHEFKRRGIPWGKIEHSADGAPKLGRLHSFDLDHRHPLKTKEGPNQGHGPVGEPKQGLGGTPWLHGVSVYQHPKPTGGVARGVMTFRVVSDKHEGSRWFHPGLEPINLFDEAVAWAEDAWKNQILPSIMERLEGKKTG